MTIAARDDLHPTVAGRMAAFGVRNAMRFAAWRARRAARHPPPSPQDLNLRGFIQINLIRPR